MQSVFSPSPTTATLSATTASSNVALTGVGSSIRVYNAGSVAVFIAWGSSATVAATTGGYPIAPGEIEIISLPGETRYVAGITASGTATVYLTPGEGA